MVSNEQLFFSASHSLFNMLDFLNNFRSLLHLIVWNWWKKYLNLFTGASIIIDNSKNILFRQNNDWGSLISNGKEPKSYLGRVFNSKFGHVTTLLYKSISSMQPLLELKTRPRVSLSAKVCLIFAQKFEIPSQNFSPSYETSLRPPRLGLSVE